MGEDGNAVKSEPLKQETGADNSNVGNQGGHGGNRMSMGMGRGGGPGDRGGRGMRRGGGSRFSGGRGGGQNFGGSGRGNNEMQIKMSESMIENSMDNSDADNRGNMDGQRNMGGKMGMGGGMMGMGGMNRGRGGRGGGRGGMGGPGGMQNRSQDDRLMEKIMSISGPTHELPPQDMTEKKFSGRNRLYIGNLTNDITEEEIQQMFQPFGETSEFFVNKEKNFAFLKLDFHANAEKAKRELDGTVRKGRVLKVRFAPSSVTIKVKNLTQWVSNELLAHAFSVFGDLERAVVIVDERGKSTGEGLVEFSRKQSAQMALSKCSDGCFFLTASLRPVVVEAYEPNDDVDGYPDKNLPKKNAEFFKFREVGPRFASIGSFEHEYGTRWKQLHELYKTKEDALKRELLMEEEKLEAQMEFAKYEHETELLREQLRIREADRERTKRDWELKERQAEEQRVLEEERRIRQQEEMTLRIRRQDEELHRRQQENNIFMQEQAMRNAGNMAGNVGGGPGNSGKNYDNMSNERDGYPQADGGNNLPADPKSFMDQYNMERNNRGGFNDDRGQIMDLMDMRVDMGNNRGGGRWQGANDRNRGGGPDDFPNKRRRY